MPTGTINGEPYSVPEGYLVVAEEAHYRNVAAYQLLGDLDRSPAGRHVGDAESQDPSGYSQGNLLLPPGTHIGHTMYGEKIVVPDGGNLSDAKQWIVREAQEDQRA